MNIGEIIAVSIASILFITLAIGAFVGFIDIDKLNKETSELDEDDDWRISSNNFKNKIYLYKTLIA